MSFFKRCPNIAIPFFMISNSDFSLFFPVITGTVQRWKYRFPTIFFPKSWDTVLKIFISRPTANTTSPSPHAPRNSLSQIFFKIGVIKNFTNFIGKHQCWSIFSIKLQAWRPATLLKRGSNTGVFLWKFLRTPFFTEHVQWLLLKKPRRSLWFIVWRSDNVTI